MDRQLKVGVVGAGVFAGYHASKVAAHPRAELVGIYDRNDDKAKDVAGRHNSKAFASPQQLALDADALIIAVPASEHFTLAETALSSGCHVLIEKPMATSLEECDHLIEAASAQNRVVQIGHQERIVMEAIGLPEVSDRPSEVQIKRHGPRSERNLDASVVMDLMIHDIDLLHSLFGEAEWISTEGAKRVYSDHWDSVRAEMGFSQFTAYLSASRDSDIQRSWVLRYETGTVEIDFANKTLTHDTPYDLNAEFGSSPDVQDSLAAAFDRFVSACLDGSPPLATGEAGRAAVRVATIIEGTS